MQAEFPADKLEPWHAVFRGHADISHELMNAARKYGEHCVQIGLARNFKIIGTDCDGDIQLHCIPHSSDTVNIFDYWRTIVDKNV